jgi:hypothetical protein
MHRPVYSPRQKISQRSTDHLFVAAGWARQGAPGTIVIQEELTGDPFMEG